MGIVNYKNGLASYGIPVVGEIPVGYGDNGIGTVYFVNYTTGSDDNNGKSPTKAFKTVDKANDTVSSGNHDVIVLAGTATHTLTEMLTVSKNKVHFVGMDGGLRMYGQRAKVSLGVTTAATDIATVEVTGQGCTFTNIKFINSNTVAQGLYCFVDAGEYTQINYCEFYKDSLLNTATAAEFVCNGDSSHYYRCTFGSLATAVTAARTNVLLTREKVAGKVCRDVTFEECNFWLKSTSNTACHMHATTATDVERMLKIKNCEMVVAKLSTGTVGDAIIVDSAQTEGQIIVVNTCNVNSTALGTTGSVGILYYGPEIATAATAGNPVAVTD